MFFGKMKAFIFLLIIFVNFCLCNYTVYWDQHDEHESSTSQGVPMTTGTPIPKYPENNPRRPPSFGKLGVVEVVHDEEADACISDTDLLSSLLNNGYSKHRVPDDNGVEVTVEFWIQEISSISELTSDFEVSIHFFFELI